MNRILRVFPHKTNATPIDDYVRIGPPDFFIPEDIEEVHISVAFSWDLEAAEILAEQYKKYAPVKIGGPAFNQPGGEFTPGLYLKQGYTITSRGCPNHCWFCAVHKREYNGLHELEIKDGWNILDDNLLACSEQHIRAVFQMLKRQKHRAVFTGGLEAKLLKPWHVELLKEVKTERIYFAYDTPDDLEPLINARKICEESGFWKPNSRKISCYVLIGYPNDNFEQAETRLKTVLKLGIVPYAMLYRDSKGNTKQDWRRFQRVWCRPEIIFSTGLKKITEEEKKSND